MAPVSAPQASNTAPLSNQTQTPESVAQTSKTPQQLKLERANAINEILSKRIIKGKGQVFDELERSVRGFLNNELGKLFGNDNKLSTDSFSKEEVQLLKFFCERLKEKENE